MNLIARAAAILLAGMLTASIAGCGRDAAPRQMKSYDNDGYLGMTNTNPNLHMNPTYHNYTVDTNMMRGALNGIRGVTANRIMTNGSRATVTLTVPPGTSDEEVMRIRSEAEQALNHAVPRYTYRLKVKTGTAAK